MGDNALELSVGRTRWFRGKGWYNEKFNDWYQQEKLGYKDFQYLGHKGSTPLAIQVHYLFRNNINQLANGNTQGLEWYYGVGGQFAFHNYKYDYRYKRVGDPNWYYSTGGSVTDIDLGLDGVIGLEYGFQNVPFSVFLDLTLFMEVLDDPFFFHYQGGTGLRYNF